MQIPTLHTARLVLLPPSIDCEALYEAFYTDAAAWARLAADLGDWHLRGFGVWAIQAQGELVGVCGFWQGKG